jgi:hypothetical protein
MLHIGSAVVPLVLGGFTSPPAIIATLVVLLLVLLVGRFLIGLAWKLVLIALVVVIGLWALGALGTVLNVIG